MAKQEEVVIVQYRDHQGKTVTRKFTPEIVNEENPHHEGKSHVDLAKEFVESNADKGAKIVTAKQAAKSEKAAPVEANEEEAADEETVAESGEEAPETDEEEAEVEKPVAKQGAKKRR